MTRRMPKPTRSGRPRGPVLPDVLTRCRLRRSGRLNHAPGLGSTARSIIGERIEKTPLLAGFLSGRRDSNSGPPVPQTQDIAVPTLPVRSGYTPDCPGLQAIPTLAVGTRDSEVRPDPGSSGTNRTR